MYMHSFIHSFIPPCWAPTITMHFRDKGDEWDIIHTFHPLVPGWEVPPQTLCQLRVVGAMEDVTICREIGKGRRMRPSREGEREGSKVNRDQRSNEYLSGSLSPSGPALSRTFLRIHCGLLNQTEKDCIVSQPLGTLRNIKSPQTR